MICCLLLALFMMPAAGMAVTSNNLPLDSPVYDYLDKLASFGLIAGDFKGIRPITGAEAARLFQEAEESLKKEKERPTSRAIPGHVEDYRRYPAADEPMSDELLKELRHALGREVSLRGTPGSAPLLDFRPLAEVRARYVYLNGAPRSYERAVLDQGGDGVFGIGAGLRPDSPPPGALVNQHGSEGTPLTENNEGVVYGRKNSIDVRFSSELFFSRYVSALVEPMLLYSQQGDTLRGRLNKGYVKVGGGGLELEAGRDASWLGPGDRGALTLTNNAANFDLIKLSSPEPIDIRYVGALKYAFIFSRFDDTVTNGVARRPWFLAAKLSVKPVDTLEIGLNLGRQVGGAGVDNSIGAVLRGFVGGTDNDNSNSLAGLEFRWRMPFLRNTEIYGEFSGEDSASVWPIVESYLAGVYIPRLTEDGRNDFRFEYFLGNNILYTNGTFPAGYIYRGMPIGHSQGGAAQDFFCRFRHWFSARHTAALEYFHTERGNTGRLPGQAVERKNGVRAVWNLPLVGRVDASLRYGWEKVDNYGLAGGIDQTNQLARVDLTYRY
jgi:hypothetical protein